MKPNSRGEDSKGVSRCRPVSVFRCLGAVNRRLRCPLAHSKRDLPLFKSLKSAILPLKPPEIRRSVGLERNCPNRQRHAARSRRQSACPSPAEVSSPPRRATQCPGIARDKHDDACAMHLCGKEIWDQVYVRLILDKRHAPAHSMPEEKTMPPVEIRAPAITDYPVLKSVSDQLDRELRAKLGRATRTPGPVRQPCEG